MDKRFIMRLVVTGMYSTFCKNVTCAVLIEPICARLEFDRSSNTFHCRGNWSIRKKILSYLSSLFLWKFVWDDLKVYLMYACVRWEGGGALVLFWTKTSCQFLTPGRIFADNFVGSKKKVVGHGSLYPLPAPRNETINTLKENMSKEEFQ